MPRFKEKYRKDVVPALMRHFSYRNIMEVPRVQKIVINVGMGKAIQDIKLLDSAVKEVAAITGQHPAITKAKRSIAGFKLRAGVSIGCKVTLRGNRMYEFLDRLINISLPRIRDFRGVSGKAFDGRGNYTLGIKEQFVFPEVDYEKVASVHGMDIVIVTTAKSDDEGKVLLKLLGLPFRD
ncbi:MAG: 50S ribosomal protein L5 [Nitrospirota bacterium]